MLALGLAVGAMGLAACGDDDEEAASEAVDSAASQVASAEEQADSALSDAGDQIDSALEDIDSAIADATADAGSVAESVAEDVSSAAEGAAGDATAGKAVFEANCAGCHTLADAGATGAVGPNLDESKPDSASVAAKVTAGGGGMPSFAGQLTPEDIANVAAYVSSVAGQ